MANTVFNNKIIEAKAKDLLISAIDAKSLMTIDDSLSQEAGMTKTINVYTYNGKAEEVANGKGNTQRGQITFTGVDYTVKMVQQAFDYTDEDFMKDNTIVDNMIKGASQVMANKITSDFIVEAKKATLTQALPTSGKIDYDTIVDAISKLNVEDESKLFVVIPNAWKADIRKDADFKTARMGEIIYSGQIGTVAGLPVIPTKALTDEAFVMSKNAIKSFVKKEVVSEQARNADTRTNSVYLRTAYVDALVDNTAICSIKAGK